MKLLFERYTLVSRLSPEELITRLQEQLGKRPSFFRLATKPYWGEIHGHSFKIERCVISNRARANVIKGDISATDTGSTIQLSMRVLIITFITMALIIAGCIFLLFLLGTSSVSVDVFLFLILFPLIIYIGAFQIFKSHVKISKAFLINLFEAKEVHQS